MKRLVSMVLLFTCLIAAGCTLPMIGDDESLPTPDVNATPTVDTPTMRAFPLGPVDVCLVKQFAAVETDQPQGDLLAWAPDDHRLAFLSPPNAYWSSYLGVLRVADLDQPEEEPFGGDSVSVFGDLAWSPDGTLLAFVVLRPSEKVYSVMIYQPASGDVFDALPSDMAHTDDFASMKSIVGWKGARLLELTSSSGDDQLQILQVDLNTNTLTPVEETRKVTDTSLQVSHSPSMQTLEALPDRQLYWSPNNQMAIYADDADLPWLVEVDREVQFPIPSEVAQSVSEIKWSFDGRMFALRYEDQIEVYQTRCKP